MMLHRCRRYWQLLLRRDSTTAAAISRRSAAAIYASSVSTINNKLQLPRCTFEYQIVSNTLPTQHSGMGSSIIPHIHNNAPSYPLQLKLLQSRWFSSNHRGRGNRRNQDPDMRVCQSIEELTQMAYEHINTMSPRGMSAYWTLVSKLLKIVGFVDNI